MINCIIEHQHESKYNISVNIVIDFVLALQSFFLTREIWINLLI